MPTGNISYEEDAAIPVADYRRLREAVGWGSSECADAELEAAFARTWNVVARRDGEIVGMGRLLDDGALYASVWDMIVVPDQHRQGIGDAILTRLLEHAASRRMVALIATAEGQPLYERHGFVPTDGGAVGMLRRRPR